MSDEKNSMVGINWEQVVERMADQIVKSLIAAFEEEYGEYIRRIAELVPDKTRSADRSEDDY